MFVSPTVYLVVILLWQHKLSFWIQVRKPASLEAFPRMPMWIPNHTARVWNLVFRDQPQYTSLFALWPYPTNHLSLSMSMPISLSSVVFSHPQSGENGSPQRWPFTGKSLIWTSLCTLTHSISPLEAHQMWEYYIRQVPLSYVALWVLYFYIYILVFYFFIIFFFSNSIVSV